MGGFSLNNDTNRINNDGNVFKNLRLYSSYPRNWIVLKEHFLSCICPAPVYQEVCGCHSCRAAAVPLTPGQYTMVTWVLVLAPYHCIPSHHITSYQLFYWILNLIKQNLIWLVKQIYHKNFDIILVWVLVFIISNDFQILKMNISNGFFLRCHFWKTQTCWITKHVS